MRALLYAYYNNLDLKLYLRCTTLHGLCDSSHLREVWIYYHNACMCFYLALLLTN